MRWMNIKFMVLHRCIILAVATHGHHASNIKYSKWVSVWFIYLSVDAWQIFDHVVICRQYRNLAAKKKFTPWPIEMRFCEDSASQHKPRYLPIFLPRCSPQFAFYFILAWFRQVWPQISTRTLFILKFSIEIPVSAMTRFFLFFQHRSFY